MNIKKGLALLLTAAMAISTAAVTAFAETETAVKIGETGYATIAEAIEAAGTSASTISLVKDITITEGVTVAAGQDITLDLGEYTLTAELPSGTNTVCDAITNNGTLSIVAGQKGTIYTPNINSNCVNNTGKLIVGKVGTEISFDNPCGPNFASTYMGVGIWNDGGEVIVNYACWDGFNTSSTVGLLNMSGTTTIKSGLTPNVAIGFAVLEGTVNVESDTWFGGNYAAMVNGGTMNINGGIAIAQSILVQGGKLNINGGDFSEVYSIYAEPENLAINGGTFKTKDLDNYTQYLPEGKAFDENGAVIDTPINLGDATAFVSTEDKTKTAGYFFNVKKAVDSRKTAVATFTAEERTVEKTLDFSSIDGEGDMTFSILLLGAPKGVTGTILYK